MTIKSRKTEVLELVTYDLCREDMVFLYRLVRAFSDFGLSIKIRKEPFIIYKGSVFHIYLIFDTEKYKAFTKNKPRKRTVVLSVETIRKRMDNGEIADEIAANFGIGRTTLFRYLKKAETS